MVFITSSCNKLSRNQGKVTSAALASHSSSVHQMPYKAYRSGGTPHRRQKLTKRRDFMGIKAPHDFMGIQAPHLGEFRHRLRELAPGLLMLQKA
eukprot:6432457-Amphidinium_carterae.1